MGFCGRLALPQTSPLSKSSRTASPEQQQEKQKCGVEAKTEQADFRAVKSSVGDTERATVRSEAEEHVVASIPKAVAQA